MTISPSRLVLASSSRYRAELLRRLGLPFTSVPHRCDESAVMTSGLPPEQVARRLAGAKAKSLRSAFPEALIIGSDQVVDLDGQILGKPGSEEAAVGQLLQMQGRTHRLITALAVVGTEADEVDLHVDVHRLRLRRLSRAEVTDYVVRDQPLDCAGSYRIESLGIALFEAVEGEDFTAIMGLPLLALVTMLRRAGLRVLG